MASNPLYCAKHWRTGRRPNHGPKRFIPFLFVFYSYYIDKRSIAHVLIKFGSNPAGMTTSEERRREVLALSAKYDFLIFEGQCGPSPPKLSFLTQGVSHLAFGSCITDDPYHYLYYGELPRPRSYFSLELDQPEVGRVVRFDSMSKILSAGMRMGFVSGPASVLNAMDMHVRLLQLGLTPAFGFDKAPLPDSDVQHAGPNIDPSNYPRYTRVMGV